MDTKTSLRKIPQLSGHQTIGAKMSGDTFTERISVKDEWEACGQKYRLVDLGAGPRELQTINPLTNDVDWRPERPCYVHGILCSRIEELVATE